MSTLVTSNISDGTTSVGTGYVVNGSAKAWVDAESTTSINDSFNVSSGTDHGTADYSYSLANSMNSIRYAQSSEANASIGFSRMAQSSSNRRTTSAFGMYFYNDGGSLGDCAHYGIINGDLA